MNESVPDEVLKATTKCPSNFSCLNKVSGEAGTGCKCNVESFLGKDLLFVRPKDKNTLLCPYLMHYGSGHICQCPTHYHRASRRKQ